MRVSMMAAVAATALAFAPACKKKEAEKAPEPVAAAPTPAAPPPVMADAAPTAAAADTMLNDMKNCPNAVAGAETKLTAGKNDLTMSIIGKDAAAETEIRARAHKLLDEAKPADGEVKHTGEGTGGGALGKCPAQISDATAKVEDSKGGVKITYTPNDATKLADLQKAAEQRLADMAAVPAPGADGAAADGKAADGAADARKPATDGAAPAKGEKGWTDRNGVDVPPPTPPVPPGTGPVAVADALSRAV